MSYIFNPQKGETPESIARLRAIARALQQGGRAPQNVGEGLNALGDGIVSAVDNYRADKAERTGLESAAADFGPIASLFGGGAQAGGVATGGAVPAPEGGGNYRDAIAGIESGGRYDAVGPHNSKLGRALGKYQMMEANIGPWSKEALGREVSADEFLKNPQLQDAIFDHKFNSYVQQYGPEGAAQAWFAGPGGVGKVDRKDVLGTDVGSYGKKFMASLGQGTPPQPTQVASLDPAAGVRQSMPDTGAVPPAYAKIPKIDGQGQDQLAKFMQWNADPVGNNEANLASIDPGLAKVVKRAQEIAGIPFVVGSGKRDEAMQAKAKEWGWSKTTDSDHLGGAAADLWPLDDSGAVVFDPARQRKIAAAMKQAAGELGVQIEAGADWKNPDLPHFGIKGGGTQVASLDPAAGMQPQPAPQQMAGLRVGGIQPDQAVETAAAVPPEVAQVTSSTDVPDGLPANSPIIRALMGLSGKDPTNPNGQFPAAPPLRMADAGAVASPVAPAASGDANVQALLKAAQNPFLTESQQAIVKSLLGEELKKRDPANKLELEKAQLELDKLRNPVGDPFTLSPGEQRFDSKGNPIAKGGDKAPEAPKIETFFDEKTGQEYKAKWNPQTGQYERVGGTKADKGGLSVITNPDGTVSVTQGGGRTMTEAQSKDTVFATKAEGSLPLIDQYGDALTSLGEQVGGNVPGIGNYLKSPEYQQAEQAGNEFLAAILRKESGAAISVPERDEYGKMYLPRPGDGPEVLAQKRDSRLRALNAIKAGMPPAAILAQEKALGKQPGDGAAAPAQRKTLNGKTYERDQNGDWYEVE